MGHATTTVAVLLAGALFGGRMAQAATWQQRAAGPYRWADANNWAPDVPNAAGAGANLDVGLRGGIAVTLDRAITIGTLTAGDRGGAAGAATAIKSVTGGKPLTFEGATRGAAAAIHFALRARPAAGYGLDLASGIRLGGTSPLTATVSSAAVFDCSVGNVDLNGNTFTLAGPPRTNDGSGATGIAWQVATITGKGHFVLNGAGVRLLKPCPDFTGALTINHGWFWFETAGLRNASRYTIAGAFTNHKKYPRGGRLQVGAAWPPVTTLPDRLNHNATMVFRGGFLDYRGQGLGPALRGQAVVEKVRQIEFAGGMSEIRITNGNDVSSSTTLLAGGPAKALVRRQGATLMIGGDDARSAKSMSGAIGVAEKLIFASGVSDYLKGGGGAPGSRNVSIIPWITLGTYYHPGQGKFVTHDRADGIRCLTDSEYFTGTVPGCPPESNVSGAKLNLGANKTQTINSYTTEAWDNTDIGPGSTLTVTSGAIRFGSGPAGIGNGSPANAGTIDFGPAEGIIWTGFDTPYGPNRIGSVVTGTGGLTMAGNNVLVLKAANTYTGKTCVGSGILQVGDGTLATSRLGDGDVEVAAGGTLRIKASVADAISDTATVSLDNTGDVFFGVIDLDGGINETVGGLRLGGVAQPAGTYGSSASAATHKPDRYFTGPG
ncbi:MAG: hypothetical protein WBF17_14975, partial [Phycisphaerae bacterium]